MKETKFAQRIKELRIGSGLTQEDLAKELNFHRTTVNTWEVKGKEPNFYTLCRLAKFFEVSTDYLLGLTDSL